MKHLGDITRIRGSGIEPVDCITGGSPCQDLSLAGKRKGLAGERSGLFMEQIRIIKEMRKIDRSIGRAGVMVRPRYMVWENVPGAFSSNKGKDFATVLEETIRIAEPEAPAVSVPEKGWPTAGILHDEMGTWSVAWRVHDAQFWGVPQRRRRIALVADFGGMSAPEILFERAGMSRDLEPSIPPWQGIARNPADSSAGYDRVVEGENDCLTPWDVQSRRVYKAFGKWPAIYAGEGGGHGYVMQSKQEHMLFAAEPVTYPGVGITSKQNASNPQPGCPCHTLNTDSRNYVCMLQTNGIEYDEKKGHALRTDGGLTAMTTVVVNAPYQQNTGPLMANSHIAEKRLRWIVRRLTPLECERLQGYPDGWTDIPDTEVNGKKVKASDSARYKALGNSIALPFWTWMFERMSGYLPHNATLGSLFDGIGGFPLCWERIHGKGTARWASEVEPFCIAVSKRRLGE